MDSNAHRLLGFARRLQQARSFEELLTICQDEANTQLGYKRVWFMVADHEDPEELRLIEYQGEDRALVWDVAPVLPVKGDAFLEAVLASDAPVVVEDARTDPRTNKAFVEALGNRTIIKVPLRLVDKPFGLFGMGTFGDEGCRAPSEEELAYLTGMAGQIAVAASRIRFVEEQARSLRETEDLKRRIVQMQKLEALGLLAGGVAHDFNNLLTIIMSCSTFLQPEVTEAGVPTLKLIQDAAQRGANLTRQLLAVSRTQQLNIRPLDINEHLDQLVALMRRLLPESITIDKILARNLPLTLGDASQIDQVFMNLFVNARDAMPDGGRITLETEHVLVNGVYTQSHPWAKQGRYVLVTVTDTGTGMSREVQDHIFEPFFTTKEARSGTGLGLAVVYGSIQQHGGMIHCYSEVGVGTSFKVYLPIAEQEAGAVGTKLEAPIVKGSAHILLAEDDEGIRDIATMILKGAGYQVWAVPNGAEACRTADERHFDLTILDVVMPGMSCKELVGRLSKDHPNLKILLSSGYTAGANVSELTQLRQLELLRKPYDPDQLLRAVQRTLGQGAK